MTQRDKQNDKVPDSDIQGTKAGKRMRGEEGARKTTSPDRVGRPSEYPMSQAGVTRKPSKP